MAPVIQNIFHNLQYKLSMTEEIKLFKWSSKNITEKISDLMDWNEQYTPESTLVKAAEQILELNYPSEYLRYSASQQKFKHSHPFYIETMVDDVSGFIDWVNNVFGNFEGLQEGLLGGLVVTPAVAGSMISVEYDKGKLVRILNKGDGDDAEMIINLMDLASIPQEISIKKNITVRGTITLKDPSKKTKGQTVTAAVNEVMFKDDADDTNLVFVPHEWLSSDNKLQNTSKLYQILKDNGFVVPAVHKSAQVIEALSKYEEFMGTDFGYELEGCRISIENGNTITSLMDIVVEDNISDFLHKVILLG